MIQFIESKFITESDSVLRSLEVAPVGQKKTSKNKALVYLLPGVVYKGPFAWPDKAPMIAQTLFRRKLFSMIWAGGCLTSGPFEMVRFANGQLFMKMPHVSARLTSAGWAGSQQPILGEANTKLVIDKPSQGLLEFSDYMQRSDDFRQNTVLIDAVRHFVHRYICDPIVGDAAPRNVLVDISGERHVAYGIDFEENRTGGDKHRALEKESGFFAMICGGKMWSKDYLYLLEATLRREKLCVLNHLKFEVNPNWENVERLIVAHSLSHVVSTARMKERCAAIVAALEADNYGTLARPKRKAAAAIGDAGEAKANKTE